MPQFNICAHRYRAVPGTILYFFLEMWVQVLRYPHNNAENK